MSNDEEDVILRDLIASSSSKLDDAPTLLTIEDIDNFFNKMMNGEFDLKERECWKCGKNHFPNYGGHLQECDECFFSRFPKEEREKFYRSFF